MPQPSGFRERLQEAVGKNTAALARRIGEAPARLYPYLAGRSLPPIDILSKIAEATDVNLHWLLTGEGPKTAARVARVPIVGRTTGGNLAAKQPGDEDLITERIETIEGAPQVVRLDIAGLRVTIRVEPLDAKGEQT